MKIKAKQMQTNLEQKNQQLFEANNQQAIANQKSEDLQQQLKKNLEDYLVQKKESEQQIETLKAEMGQAQQDLENKLYQASQDVNNLKATEEKLRAQLVETSKNANISQSQLEANLTEKIKSLDGQNEQYVKQIQQLQKKQVDLEKASQELTRQIEDWKNKHQMALNEK